MVEFSARTNFSGNLFTGNGADRIMAQYEDAVERAGAERAEQLIQSHLGTVLRNPTGFYQSQIGVRRSNGDWAVTDNNVVYGPWLEGTGSRNAPVTSFRGYRTFRHVAQMMDRQIQRIGERLLQRFVSNL